MNIDEYNASLEAEKGGQTQDQKDNADDIDDLDGIFDYGDDEDEDDVDTDDTDDSDDTDDDNDTDEQDENSDDQNIDDNENQDDQEQKEPDKKQQSAEENARFAEMRRQQQLEQQVQDRMKQSPEYQIAQMLAQRYGVSTDQMLNQLKENALAEQAQKQGVPIEYLRRQQELEDRIRQQELQFQEVQFERWKTRVDGEMKTVKTDYPMLDDNDLKQAVDYMFQVGNTDLPLDQAVFAVHGKKIATALKEQAEQDALATVSGRKPSPLKPQGGKPNPTVQLSADEKYVAKMMGITEKEYLKYKTN